VKKGAGGGIIVLDIRIGNVGDHANPAFASLANQGEGTVNVTKDVIIKIDVDVCRRQSRLGCKGSFLAGQPAIGPKLKMPRVTRFRMDGNGQKQYREDRSHPSVQVFD
jgi:hypothetical protein